MSRDEYLQYVSDMVEEDTDLQGDDLSQAIYMIDEIIVYGGFCGSTRGVDHNILLLDGITWDNLLEWGIVIVPEIGTYISNYSIRELEQLDYIRLPLDDNHIAGYKPVV